MGNVVVIGSLNVDVTFSVDEFPDPGDDRPVRRSARSAGGKALSQAIAAHRCGAQVVLVGRVGRDPFGAELVDLLAQEGLDVSRCEVVGSDPTGLAVIVVEPDGRNTILFEPGAVRALRPPLALDLSPGDIVLSHGGVPTETLHRLYEDGRAAGCLTVLVGMHPGQLPVLGTLVDLLIVNEFEVANLLGRGIDVTGPDPELAAALDPLRLGAQSRVVVTCGQHGVLLRDARHQLRRFPITPVVAVDTTAAGDALTGVLAASLSRGVAFDAALRAGMAAAAITVTRIGAASSLPSRPELTALLEDHRATG